MGDWADEATRDMDEVDLAIEAAKDNPAPAIEWEAIAAAAMANITQKAEGMARRAADDFYSTLLYSVQDYLTENATLNIKSRIEAANQQAASDRRALFDERGRIAALEAMLREGVQDMSTADRLRWKDRAHEQLSARDGLGDFMRRLEGK